MKDQLEHLIDKIKKLESELRLELQKKEAAFYYTIDRKKVYFRSEITFQHRRLTKKIRRYLLEASFLNTLTAPLIWAIICPALFLDLFISLFQMICFPIYKIPKVKRSDYIIIDRHALSYLNIIEKVNCIYCGYFNGLIAYSQEIAARTEQYWCPIKHARRLHHIHNRYQYFIDYGDAETYRKKFEQRRQDFTDLKKEKNT